MALFHKNSSHLDSQALGFAFAILGFLGWLAGLIWHGGMGQPMMMSAAYPGFSMLTPVNALGLLVLFVAGGYIYGELLARLYNWFLGRK